MKTREFETSTGAKHVSITGRTNYLKTLTKGHTSIKIYLIPNICLVVSLILLNMFGKTFTVNQREKGHFSHCIALSGNPGRAFSKFLKGHSLFWTHMYKGRNFIHTRCVCFTPIFSIPLGGAPIPPQDQNPAERRDNLWHSIKHSANGWRQNRRRWNRCISGWMNYYRR